MHSKIDLYGKYWPYMENLVQGFHDSESSHKSSPGRKLQSAGSQRYNRHQKLLKSPSNRSLSSSLSFKAQKPPLNNLKALTKLTNQKSRLGMLSSHTQLNSISGSIRPSNMPTKRRGDTTKNVSHSKAGS